MVNGLASFKSQIYSDQEGKIIGVKFWHSPSGAPVFLSQIETIPQAFMIDTPADSVDADKGLPHALEHLLGGKGTKGRYVNLLRELRLGNTIAATDFDRNFYALSSSAGTEAFFEELHSYMDSIYHPTSRTWKEREFYQHWRSRRSSDRAKKSIRARHCLQ